MLRSLLIGAIGVAVAVGLAWLPLLLAADAAHLATIDTLVVALLLIAVAVVPFFAQIGNLEPRQFSAFPASPGQVATALFVSTPLSWPALWLLVWMAALVFLRPQWLEATWVAAGAAVLTLLVAVAFVRVASALVRLFVARTALSALRWVGLLLLLAALPLVVFILTQAFREPRNAVIREAARVFGFSPFGAPVASINVALAGDSNGALVHLGVLVVTLIVLLVAWYLLVARSLSTIEKPVSVGESGDGLEIFERFSARPRSVIAARALTYWRRDPRYRVALIGIPLAPVVMVIALWVAGVDWPVLALIPLPVMMLLFGWSVHNDVAYDSTAIWLHVASGTKGSHDRIGRLVPVLLFGLPVVIIGSSLSVTFSGDWRLLPAVIGMNFGVLMTAAAVSSVFSALMPYPATRPGDSPFAQPAATQGTSGAVAQTVSMLVALLLCLPPVVAAVNAMAFETLESNISALLFGIAWGLGLLALGVWLGGRVFERRAPELVALTQMYD